jgi:hypothetical protein
VRPKSKELRTSKAEEVTDEEVDYEIHSLDGAKESLKNVAESIRILKEENLLKELPKFPIVTFLGTGSTVPSKYRNVSSILLETHKGDSFLKGATYFIQMAFVN